jgi:hypothetical protein
MDSGRYLDRNPTRPPTTSTWRAAAGEPEMVSADYEKLLAERARLREKRRQQEEWKAARGRFVDGVEIVKTSHLPRAVISDVRVIERVLRRVDGRLGAT